MTIYTLFLINIIEKHYQRRTLVIFTYLYVFRLLRNLIVIFMTF